MVYKVHKVIFIILVIKIIFSSEMCQYCLSGVLALSFYLSACLSHFILISNMIIIYIISQNSIKLHI